MILMPFHFTLTVVRFVARLALQSVKNENKQVQTDPVSWSSFSVAFPSLESYFFAPWI